MSAAAWRSFLKHVPFRVVAAVAPTLFRHESQTEKMRREIQNPGLLPTQVRFSDPHPQVSYPGLVSIGYENLRVQVREKWISRIVEKCLPYFSNPDKEENRSIYLAEHRVLRCVKREHHVRKSTRNSGGHHNARYSATHCAWRERHTLNAHKCIWVLYM
jgi:hypothetical protein